MAPSPSEKVFQKSNYLAALALTLLVFGTGIFLGNHFSASKLDQIEGLQQELNSQTLGAELQTLLLTEFPCSSFNSTITDELFDVGSKLDYMEGQMGKTNTEVLTLKEYYSLLEIRHWLLLKLAKERCGTEYNLILYFYSNLGDCDTCEQQGYVLSTLHKKYPRLNIYSFDANIRNPALQTVKTIFGVRGVPTLVINHQALAGFKNKNEIEALLFKKDSKKNRTNMNETSVV